MELTPKERRRQDLKKAYETHRQEAVEYLAVAMCETYMDVTGHKATDKLREAIEDALTLQ